MGSLLMAPKFISHNTTIPNFLPRQISGAFKFRFQKMTPIFCRSLGYFDSLDALKGDRVGRGCVFARYMLRTGAIKDATAKFRDLLPTEDDLKKFGLSGKVCPGTVCFSRTNQDG
jgi:hypothetical protein